MYMMDVDTLTVIQRERYQDFQRQADLLRLLRTQQETSNTARVPATAGRGKMGLIAALQQMVSSILPMHSRVVPRR